jgi:uncharacterized protein (DUF1499 family)
MSGSAGGGTRVPGGVARLACTMVLISCAGARPAQLGLSAGGLAPCPASPNCVSSDAADSAHAIPPLDLAVAPDQAWRAARAALEGMPRTRVVTDTGSYLHAECTSAIFRFVDDLELQLRAGEGRIAMRSASRLGYGDMGVNRRRAENLRALLTREGILAPR